MDVSKFAFRFLFIAAPARWQVPGKQASDIETAGRARGRVNYRGHAPSLPKIKLNTFKAPEISFPVPKNKLPAVGTFPIMTSEWNIAKIAGTKRF